LSLCTFNLVIEAPLGGDDIHHFYVILIQKLAEAYKSTLPIFRTATDRQIYPIPVKPTHSATSFYLKNINHAFFCDFDVVTSNLTNNTMPLKTLRVNQCYQSN
jgi:hypothetical protein